MLIVVTAIVINQHPKTLAQLPEAGYRAPNFILHTLSGHPIELSQLKGKPVLINFFASWCPPCQAEAPDLVQMYDRYHTQVVFLGVDMTESDSRSAVQAFMKKVGIHYPIVLDSLGKVAKQYDVISIPMSFFVNAQGVIVARVAGAMNRNSLASELSHLLSSQNLNAPGQ